MPNTFYTQLLTPEGALFEGDVESVQVPGSSGKFQVLYNHAPLVSSLGIGEITITKDENTEFHYAVSGGFVEINDNHCTFLAEKAELAADIDTDEVNKLRIELKEKLNSLKYNREEIEIEIAIAENRLKVAGL